MTEQKQRILVVDDEPQLTRVLLRSLTSNGYEVRIAGDGKFALQTFRDWPPALVITDLAMPNMDGLQLCRRVRELSQVPIIVLSVRGEEKTKVEALDAGADDYVTKPFGMDELLARIRATLRRKPATDSTERILKAGDFRVDLDAHLAMHGENELRLTPKEFELLVHLVRNPGKVLTHRALLGAVWAGITLSSMNICAYSSVNCERRSNPIPQSRATFSLSHGLGIDSMRSSEAAQRRSLAHLFS